MDSQILSTVPITGFAEYQRHLAHSREQAESRSRYELALLQDEQPFTIRSFFSFKFRALALLQDEQPFTTPGFCAVCQQQVEFLVDYQFSGKYFNTLRIPNWRERLLCPNCQLNNRMRACIHFLCGNLVCSPNDAIYITEQVTPLYGELSNRFPGLVGSEYLGNKHPYGTVNEAGVRNESITRLSFDDESFRLILSFDVFEHVPDYVKALKECLRCLKPGGTLLFTVPFDRNIREHRVRARVRDDGEVEHLLEPEYHGDPVNDAGCLCFYHFGWQLLDEMSDIGFSEVTTHLYWSDRFGYLGGEQLLFTATRQTTRISHSPRPLRAPGRQPF